MQELKSGQLKKSGNDDIISLSPLLAFDRMAHL